MKEGVLFRSARPDDATLADRAKLRDELKLRTVLDLRTKCVEPPIIGLSSP